MANFGKVIFLSAALAATGMCFAESPDWVLKQLYTKRPMKVAEVYSKLGLVEIDSGSQSNLRSGAFCKIYREGKYVGDVVVVDSNKTKAVAMLTSDITVQKGDAAYITPAN